MQFFSKYTELTSSNEALKKWKWNEQVLQSHQQQNVRRKYARLICNIQFSLTTWSSTNWKDRSETWNFDPLKQYTLREWKAET